MSIKKWFSWLVYVLEFRKAFKNWKAIFTRGKNHWAENNYNIEYRRKYTIIEWSSEVHNLLDLKYTWSLLFRNQLTDWFCTPVDFHYQKIFSNWLALTLSKGKTYKTKYKISYSTKQWNIALFFNRTNKLNKIYNSYIKVLTIFLWHFQHINIYTFFYS